MGQRCGGRCQCAGHSYVKRPVSLVLASELIGFTVMGCIVSFCIFGGIAKPAVNGAYIAASPVAVVGAGPSGLAAAWMLAKGGRRVVLFEANDRFGGHSKSWTSAENHTIDLGFIFNNAADDAYTSYKAVASHYGTDLLTTALNISGAHNGEYWDNTYTDRHFDAELESEVDSFMKSVNIEKSTARYIMPFGLWMWLNGYSDRFRKLCLDSTMSVLFVTKMGLDRQSAGAVLDFFRMGEGFTHLRYDAPKVQLNPGGSQNMWQKLVNDLASTGRFDMRLSSAVTAVEREDDAWTLTANGEAYRGFSDVVLAVPANVATKIHIGAPFQNLIVNQMDYVDAQVTLHTDHGATLGQTFQQASGRPVQYFVTDEHMTGKIGDIFQDPGSDLLLTVHGQGRDPLHIDPQKTLWQTTWQHHYFTIWELLMARRFLPLFNGNGGLHYSGDWVYGVGHNDAIKSGVHAACAAGVTKQPADSADDPLYSTLLRETCAM